MKNVKIIITGTDPDSAKGGIGVVLPGYFTALQLAGFNYECIPTYNPTTLKGKWLPWLRAFPKIFRAIKKIKKEGSQAIVYSHTGGGASLFRETSVLWLAKLLGAKTVFQIHSAIVDNYLNSYVKNISLKFALIPADTVCVLTDWWKSRLLDGGINAVIHVIPNPLPENLLDIALQTREASLAGSNDPIVILSMARLVQGKGVDIMIRAIGKLPDNIRLVIAGDGSQREELEKLVSDLGVSDRVHFAGWASGDKKNQLLKEADIFCLPSTYDAFPMSMVEAMAYGLPVVAVRWGGIPDMVSDGYSGFLAEHANADEIADAIKKLLPIEMRQKIGIQAKEWVIQISHPEHVAKKLEQVIEELPA